MIADDLIPGWRIKVTYDGDLISDLRVYRIDADAPPLTAKALRQCKIGELDVRHRAEDGMPLPDWIIEQMDSEEHEAWFRNEIARRMRPRRS